MSISKAVVKRVDGREFITEALPDGRRVLAIAVPLNSLGADFKIKALKQSNLIFHATWPPVYVGETSSQLIVAITSSRGNEKSDEEMEAFQFLSQFLERCV